MRDYPYAGPDDTDDFDGLDPERASHVLRAYKLLGDAFEEATDDDLMDRGWLLDDPLALVQDRAARLQQAVRELTAAVELAKHQGFSEGEIRQSERGKRQT